MHRRCYRQIGMQSLTVVYVVRHINKMKTVPHPLAVIHCRAHHRAGSKTSGEVFAATHSILLGAIDQKSTEDQAEQSFKS